MKLIVLDGSVVEKRIGESLCGYGVKEFILDHHDLLMLLRMKGDEIKRIIELMSIRNGIDDHHGDWVNACEIAKSVAESDSDKLYWQKQLDTLEALKVRQEKLTNEELLWKAQHI